MRLNRRSVTTTVLGISIAGIAGCGSTASAPSGTPANVAESTPETSDADANAGDPDGTNGDADGTVVDPDATSVVTFTLNSGVFRIEVGQGSIAQDISQGLDALSSGSQDEALNTSPNGEWLVLETDRFDPECVDSSCLAVVASDLSEGATVHVNGEVVRADASGTDAFSAISNDGNLLVFPGSQGPNEADLFVVRRISDDEWTSPELLTGGSSFAFNAQPAISSDGESVVFDCGPTAFGQEGTNICEVETSGDGFRIVRLFDDPPPGLTGGNALHHADFAPDGSIVFEGDWDSEQIWRLPSGGELISVGGVNNDNSPCVLPDGRVASLTFGDDGFHQIEIKDADGGNSFVLFTGEDVVDIGLGCGGGTGNTQSEPEPDTDVVISEDQGLVTFPASSVWYEDISFATLDVHSDDVIDFLESKGGFGFGRMQVDFSIEVLHADASTQFQAFTPTEDHFSPDCDFDDLPVPDGGALEGEDGYECEGDGDCHLIVVHEPTNTLYEMWRADIVDGTFFGGCLAVWDLTRDYGGEGRGQDCTSADAAGFPIAPLLFNADEVAAGSIDHAIRFILPNERIRERAYIEPATHSTGATSGPDTAPPYGARFRLRSDYPLDHLPNEGARVVARAMQTYGIILADSGNVALTAQSDRFTTAKWEGLLGSRDLDIIEISDFEMIEMGTEFTFTGDCIRVP